MCSEGVLGVCVGRVFDDILVIDMIGNKMTTTIAIANFNEYLGNLPNTFTICSSLHVKYVTEWIHFYQLYSVSTNKEAKIERLLILD